MPVAARAQLSSRQRRFLQDQGYLVVRSLLDQAVLTGSRDRLQELVRQTVAAWADEPSLDTTDGCVVAEFDVTDPDFAPVISIPCSPTRPPPCWAIAGMYGISTCGRRSPAAASRACTRITPNAGPGGRGRRSRPCGAGRPSPATPARCGSARAPTAAPTRRATASPS